jgi:short-subunit dehydrogenase involved in D-alanine esterification of teichoic acids
MFLDIIHRPVIYLKHRPVYISKHNVSETGFCLRLQVKATQLGPIDMASPYLRTKRFITVFTKALRWSLS